MRVSVEAVISVTIDFPELDNIDDIDELRENAMVCAYDYFENRVDYVDITDVYIHND